MSVSIEKSGRVALDVVMPVRNGADTIEQNVSAIIDLADNYPDPFRLAVVNDGSSDCTGRILETIKDNRLHIVTNRSSQGRAVARNQGAREGDFEYIVFLDADCTPANGEYLLAFRAAFQAGADVVAGSIGTSNLGFWGRYVDQVAARRHRAAKNNDWVNAITSANFGIKRWFFERLGGFDEAFAEYGFEDRDLFCRLLETASLIVMADKARVLHRMEQSACTYCAKLETAAMFTAPRFYAKHPNHYRQTAYAALDVCTRPGLTARWRIGLLSALATPAVKLADLTLAVGCIPYALNASILRFASASSYARGVMRRPSVKCDQQPDSSIANLYIVITDFNGFAQTRRCLAALLKSVYQEFTTIVVDHGTSTETREGIASLFPEVERVAASPDLWWSGATNRGIEHALSKGAGAIILLNNDCYVTPEAIDLLVEAASKNPQMIVAPVQRDSISREITSLAPRSVLALGLPTVRGPKAITPSMARKDVIPVSLISGGRGALVPSEVFRRIGLLDEENLPHYGADHDFYYRALASGFSLGVCPKAFVDVDNDRTSLATQSDQLGLRHFRMALTERRSHRNIRDVVALFRKHYPLKKLYYVGVCLFVVRYTIVYFSQYTAQRIETMRSRFSTY